MGICYSSKTVPEKVIQNKKDSENKKDKGNNPPQKSQSHTVISTNPSTINRGSEEVKFDTSIGLSPYKPGEQYYLINNQTKKPKLGEFVKMQLTLKNMLNIHNTYKINLTLISEAKHCKQENNEIGQTEELPPQKNEINFNTSFIFPYQWESKQELICTFIKNRIETNRFIFPIPQLMESLYKDNLHHIDIDEYDKAQFGIKVQKGFSSNLISYMSLHFTLNKGNTTQSIFFYVENKPMIKETIWRMVYKSNIYALNNSNNDNSDNKEIKANTIIICKDALVYQNNPELRIVVCDSESLHIIGYAFFPTTVQHHKDCYTRVYIKTDNKSKDITVGEILVKYYELKWDSFSDLIKDKLQIGFTIGIDYTQSNSLRNASLDFSLNSLSRSQYIVNDYEKALFLCGNAFNKYNKGQLYSVYGFGAIILGQKDKGVNHCFPINFDDANPQIPLIENIITLYRYSHDKVIVSGPSCIAPLIAKVIRQIKSDMNNKPNELRYYAIILLTDGLIYDMKEVRDLIVNALTLPLSIMIIGIGDGYFEYVKELEGIIQQRKVVKFVRFNFFEEGKDHDNDNDNDTSFAKQIAQHIKHHVVEYYHFIKIQNR